MFGEKKQKRAESAGIFYDNVAVPEVHFSKKQPDDLKKEGSKDIEYENLAIPEIHIRTKRK